MSFAEAGGGDWVWITLAAGAVCTVLGALAKTLNDVVTSWFRAKAEAKLTQAKAEAVVKIEEAKIKAEEDATAIGQWQGLYEESRRRNAALEAHVARQDAHIDELGRRMGDLAADHAECQVQMSDIYGDHVLMHDFCLRCAGGLEKHGIDVGKVPPLAERPRRTHERRAAAEFAAREAAQNTAAVKSVTNEILKANGGQP
jgi:NADPH:quinone reductase-like Zn-dependent oxidoreductase